MEPPKTLKEMLKRLIIKIVYTPKKLLLNFVNNKNLKRLHKKYKKYWMWEILTAMMNVKKY